MEAVKAGDLDKLKTEEPWPEEEPLHPTTDQNETLLDQKQINVRSEACNNLKSTNEVHVEHGLILSPRHSDIQHIVIREEKVRSKFVCCILL